MFGAEGKAAGARLVDTYMKPVFPSPWEDTWDTEYKSGGGALKLISKSGQLQICFKICHGQEVGQRLRIY